MRITPLWWSWRDSAVIAAVIGLAVFLFVGLLRRDTLMGLFPFSGEIDNPVVLAMVTIFVVLSLPFLFSAIVIEPVRDSAVSIVFLGGSTTAWGGWTDAVDVLAPGIASWQPLPVPRSLSPGGQDGADE